MDPIEFYRKAEAHFTTGLILPPVVGRAGNLRVAAGLIREGREGRTVDLGVVLLAGANYSRRREPPDTTCLKLIGEVTIGGYSSNGGQAWKVEIGIVDERLAHLIGKGATDQLIAGSSLVGRPSEDEKVVGLTVYHPGIAPGDIPSINGIPLEKW